VGEAHCSLSLLDSAICRESNGHLLLYTTITLGYDLPWRTIQQVLIDAAKATPHIQMVTIPPSLGTIYRLTINPLDL